MRHGNAPGPDALEQMKRIRAKRRGASLLLDYS